MRVSLTTNNFEKDLLNIANYSLGFLEGAQKGKKVFLDNLGRGVIFALGEYIDVEARGDVSLVAKDAVCRLSQRAAVDALSNFNAF